MYIKLYDIIHYQSLISANACSFEFSLSNELGVIEWLVRKLYFQSFYRLFRPRILKSKMLYKVISYPKYLYKDSHTSPIFYTKKINSCSTYIFLILQLSTLQLRFGDTFFRCHCTFIKIFSTENLPLMITSSCIFLN